jgi:hypothetical protein
VQVDPTSGIMATTLAIAMRSAFLSHRVAAAAASAAASILWKRANYKNSYSHSITKNDSKSCTNSCRVNSMAEPSITSEIEQAQYTQPKEHHKNPETSQLPLGSWPSLSPASTLALASVQGRCRVARALPRAARLPPLCALSR